MTTGKRPDKAAKQKLKKVQQETVVKCSLGTLLRKKDNEKYHNDVLTAIRQRVEQYSKRVHLASIAINMMIREHFNSVPTDLLHRTPLPEFTDTTFIYQFLTNQRGSPAPFPVITDFFRRHRDIYDKLAGLARPLSDRNIYSFGATKLSTNIKNHFMVNLTKWVKKYLYAPVTQSILLASAQRALANNIYETPKDQKAAIKAWVAGANKTILYHLHGWPLKGQPVVEISDLPSGLRRELIVQKEILGDGPISNSWWKSKTGDCYANALRYSVYVNRFLELNELPMFNILPLCGIKTHFITIDTSVLHGIFRDAGIVDCSYTTFATLGMSHWESQFNFARVAGKTCTFTGTMDTDGTAACFHFMRPKVILSSGIVGKKTKSNAVDPKLQKESLEQILGQHPNAHVVGIDPGRTCILYAVKRKLVDGVVDESVASKEYILSRKQFYIESGAVKANKKCAVWQSSPEVKSALEELAHASPKGVDLSAFKVMLEVVMKHYTVLWTEYTKPRWAQQRLRLYGGKKRVFAKFFNRLQGDSEKVIVAYGAAKFSPVGKGELAVPTCRAFKECSYRFPTFPVDEYRTTMLWNGDKTTVLQTVVKKSDGKKVRGLLWCCSTRPSKSKYVARDLNAALNILDCLLMARRPALMCRDVKGSLKEQHDVVGRKTKC